MSRNTLSASHLHIGNFGKILFSTLLIYLIFALPASAQQKEKIWRTLTVRGRGVQTITTTLSQVSLGVVVEAKTAAQAQKQVSRQLSAVIALLKSRNVEQLQTTRISLTPIYSYRQGVQQVSTYNARPLYKYRNRRRRITGYTARNTVSFRYPTDKLGILLDEAVKIGATQINNVSFVATDTAIDNAYKQALQKATQDAKQQADLVFGDLGLQPQDVISIRVNRPRLPRPRRFYRGRRGASSVNFADVSTPIIGAEQKVEASVTLKINY